MNQKKAGPKAGFFSRARITWQRERQPVRQQPEQQPEQRLQQAWRRRPEQQPERQRPEQQEPGPEQRQEPEREQEQLLLFCRKRTKKRPTGRRAGANVSSCEFPLQSYDKNPVEIGYLVQCSSNRLRNFSMFLEYF